MKFVNLSKLNIGDWVVTSGNIKEGKFQFGKVIGYNIQEIFEMDLTKGELKRDGKGELNGDGATWVANKKDLDNLMKLKVKLGIINELKDESFNSRRGEGI